MSQGFKLRFDQLRESDPTGPNDATSSATDEHYSSAGYTRNLCLVWPNGRRAFFNYAYLVAGEYEPNDERNVIKLSFSSHNVTLQGYSLEPLFMELLDHTPRLIAATDPRYILAEAIQEPAIVAIIMERKDD